MWSIYKIILIAIIASDLLKANATYDAAIERVISTPTAENVFIMGGHLRGIAQYSRTPESDPYFLKIRQTLLATPGHARYYRDEILRTQAELEKNKFHNILRSEYDEARGYGLIVLSYLPSPETISVLGELLSNDFVEPDPAEDKKPVDYSKIDWSKVKVGSEVGCVEAPRYSNSWNAATIIMDLGLRDPPVPYSKYGLAGKKDVEATRAWWAEVKSGQRTFSFKGQAEEYRFNPDGTWETIPIVNPPDDAVRLPKAEEPKKSAEQTKQDESKPEQKKPSKGSSLWLWILFSAMIAGSVYLFTVIRRKRHA